MAIAAKILLLSILQFFVHIVAAQTIRQIPLHIHSGMGAYGQKAISSFASAENIAAITQYDKFQAGFIFENRFGLKDITNYYANAAGKIGNLGYAGASFNYLGNSTLNEFNAQLQYARKLGEKAALGVGFNYYNINAATYGKAQSIQASIGLLLHLNSQVSCGIQAHNLGAQKFGINKTEKLGNIVQLGIGYTPANNFYCSASLIKEENFPLYATIKFQYAPIDKLKIEAGINTNNNNYSLGVGFFTKNIYTILGIGYAARLGGSPFAAAAYVPQ
jgi:hypothetical protein